VKPIYEYITIHKSLTNLQVHTVLGQAAQYISIVQQACVVLFLIDYLSNSAVCLRLSFKRTLSYELLAIVTPTYRTLLAAMLVCNLA
jgi:hypothetical protein